ncbi:MAG: hypothetical protein CW336_00930 [Bacteroidetes bacterium]|nr:hypothetical protein [Bacteroidota bacterium]
MKKVLLVLLAVLFCGTLNLNAQKKSIKVTPDNAKIYVDGDYVGDGTYIVKFSRNEDFVRVKCEATGYVTKEFSVKKSDTRKTIGVKLVKDEAYDNSVASELANKYFTIRVRQGIDEDKAWKLLTQVMLEYFPELKTADKASGYMNTTWAEQAYGDSKVRTMVQIKESSIDGLAYQIKIFSERNDDYTNDPETYKPWPRVLKKYEPLINEMQMRLGDK